LPPDARFCHKCGKPQYDYPDVQNPVAAPPPLPPPLPLATAAAEISFRNGIAVRISFMVAALALIFAMVASPLLHPPLSLIAGVFLAGFVATLWYERRTGQRLSVRSGAQIGWITGIFSFSMFVAVTTVQMIVISVDGGLANYVRKQMHPTDPNVEQALKLLSDPVGAAVLMLLCLVLFFVVFTTLPMLGGAVGAKVSERRV
jgi:uncharacterized protein YqgC (DUF456 family)